MGSFLRSRLVWVAATVVALLGLYALFGFYAVPRIVRSQAIEFVHSNYGRALSIGEVHFNPFRLQLEISDFAVPDTDAQTLVGFKRLFIDFEASSLWHRAYTFKDVDIEAPTIRAVIRADGSVNLADLAPKPTPRPEPTPQAERGLPAVWIQSLVLSGGAADFVDQARRNVYARHFAPLAFRLTDFRTTPQGGVFSLSTRGERVDNVTWKGHIALEPGIRSEGEFAVTNLHADDVSDLLGDALPFLMTSGNISFGGRYQFETGGNLHVKAELPKIALTGLGLRARGADADWVQITSIELNDTKLATPEHAVTIGSVLLAGMKSDVWRSTDGSVNLQQLFAPSPATAQTATSGQPSAGEPSRQPPAQEEPVQSTPAGPAWKVAVGAVDVRDAAVAFEDRTVQPAAKFALAPVNVGLKDLSLDLARPLPVTFDLRINGKGQLSGSGRITPAPLAADMDLDLAGLEMADLQPYVAGRTGMTIESGSIAAKGKARMTPPGGAEPDLSFAGDVTLADFRSVDNVLSQDFVKFARVEIAGLRYAMAPDSVSIERIRVVRPFGRVSISAEQVVNVAAVLDPEGTAKALQERKAAEAAKASAASAKKTRAELRAEKKAAEDTARARAKAPPAPEPELRETGTPIRVRELRVEDGQLDFSDLSVQPNFAANITSLQGRVTGMSSDPKARAKIELQGKVGEFSPVTISGETQPFAFDRYTDIGMKFENISLPIFNPYSGKFAGYSIAKGKLTTDLHYLVRNRALEATHHVRIDQLEWGEATAEKGEATLPVKFATSLLKDGDGVISLDIPVKGTLDDPKFRIGPIIWQIIKNLLTKVVSAPFKALGALFKGSEEAQFVDFAPGQPALDAATAERLAGLARALAPKSDIRLNVPIGSVAELDAASMTDQRYAQELEAATRQVLLGRQAASDKPTSAFATLDTDTKIDVLSALVERLSGARPKLPPPPVVPEGTSRKDRKAIEAAAAIDYLQTEARSRVTPSPAQLDELAQQRGEAIQHALLDGTGLDPQRVFVVRNGKVTAQDGKVRFELGME